ncbi:hypothetical protein [Rhodopila sp.]|uniref:hypothetical protein n=1 Tax=Rhodopila sp. TaxID=2480087 RepID=UPI003D13DB51
MSQPTRTAEAGNLTSPSTPACTLMDMVTTFLTPLVMAGGIADLAHARHLATQTLLSYGPSTEADLIKIMQIVGFGLGAMDNMRLSAGDAATLSMKLRLRGCANGLNRSAQQNNQALEKDRHQRGTAQPMMEHDGTTAWPQPGPAEQAAAEAECQAAIDAARTQIEAARAGIKAAPAAPTQSAPTQALLTRTAPPRPTPPQPATTAPAAATAITPAAARPTANRANPPASASDDTQAAANEAQRRLIWASAMADVAAELQADLASQSPQQRADNQSWINSLTGAAGSLAAQSGSPGSAYKSSLLGSTTLGSTRIPPILDPTIQPPLG